MTHSGLSPGDCIKILLYTVQEASQPHWGTTEQSCGIVTLLNFVSFSNYVITDAMHFAERKQISVIN
jgi:hypothetical protein